MNYFCPSKFFEDYFRVIKQMVPATEYTPAVLLTDEDFEEEEYIKSTAPWLTKLVTYDSRYGNWGDDYGCDGNWKLTKNRIARDIQDAINKMEDDDDAYIPEWIEKETEYYLNK